MSYICIHGRVKGKVGVSRKEMRKVRLLCILRYVQKSPVKMWIDFAVKILRLLNAGVNQNAGFLAYASW